MIDDYLKEKVRDAASIVDEARRLTALKPNGANKYLGLCPFHKEKTPSFTVTPDRGIFKCFGCGKGGDVFELFKARNINFNMAFMELARRYNVSDAVNYMISNRDEKLYKINRSYKNLFQKGLKMNAEGRKYLKDRKFKKEAWESWGVGYNYNEYLVGYVEELRDAGLYNTSHVKPRCLFQNRLMFPIEGNSGNIIGWGGRTLDKDWKSKGIPKYLNSAGSRLFSKQYVLYGFYRAQESIKAQDHVYVVEGYTDVIMKSQYAYNNVVATCGTAFTVNHAKLLSNNCGNFTFIFDGDEAGKKAASLAIPHALSVGVEPKIILLPKGQDPASLLVEDHVKYQLYLDNPISFLDFLMEGSLTEEMLNTVITGVSKMAKGLKRWGIVQRIAAASGMPASDIDMMVNEASRKALYNRVKNYYR